MIPYIGSVSPTLFDLIRSLQEIPAFQDFYLGGGTSLALRFGHRTSMDIDLFSKLPFDSEICMDSICTCFPAAEIVNRTQGSLFLLIHGIKIDVLFHPYPLVAAPSILDNIRFLSLPDIAAMKINAVTNRGSKKDFSDLLLLHEEGISLAQSLDFFTVKYGNAGRFLAIRSLAWFEDAELEPDPQYRNGWTWETVRQRIEELTAIWTSATQ